ncbi:galactose-3-O-sulfotransferase 3-like [Pecten maximus]|uniref:galactose-3-O-sulfotransferase 3-like n=1 Tax=Pecten maximus TaxID=6579 RepID=UPI001458F31C|nr:galactose-3-O-sulfotransferase 3-like [Pecten maximus]
MIYQELKYIGIFSNHACWLCSRRKTCKCAYFVVSVAFCVFNTNGDFDQVFCKQVYEALLFDVLTRYMLVGLCLLVAMYGLIFYINKPPDYSSVILTNLDPPPDRKKDSAYENNISPGKLSKHNPYIQSPVNHVVFLKIHKAASTTVANIFVRYGYENHLVIAVPKGRGGGGPSTSPRYFYPPRENGKYDICCAHVPYIREEFDKVFHKDTKYIGIVREPFSHFKSFVSYFRPRNVVKLPGINPVLEYLENEKHEQFERYSVGRAMHKIHDFNLMANEFGFPQELFFNKNQTKIESYLRKLDMEMDFVLVVEYLDESLVLMRRLLNWDLRHMLHANIHVNKRRDARLNFGSNEENLYKVRSYLDYALYDFFLLKFQTILKRQHPDFYDELAYFREVRSSLRDFCSGISTTLGNTTITFEGSEWNEPFVLKKDQCKSYVSSVMLYNKIIKEQGLWRDL